MSSILPVSSWQYLLGLPIFHRTSLSSSIINHEPWAIIVINHQLDLESSSSSSSSSSSYFTPPWSCQPPSHPAFLQSKESHWVRTGEQTQPRMGNNVKLLSNYKKKCGYIQISLKYCRHLLPNQLVSLSKHVPPFRMAKHCPFCATILILRSVFKWLYKKERPAMLIVKLTKTIWGLCSPVKAPLAAL